MKPALDLLKDSPFFDRLPEGHLEALARHAELRAFPAGEAVIREGDPAEAFFLLAEGRVRLSFDRPEAGTHRFPGRAGEEILIRSIGEPGRTVGWSCMVEPHVYRATATAETDSRLLSWDRPFLRRYAEEHPDFGVAFMERIIWLLGNRLRATRIRLVARRYEREVLAVRALLDQAAESLPVTSPLHKLPVYLENRLTLSDAFQTLELLKTHGESVERGLAELCLDVLQGVRREMALFQHQQAIYDRVAAAPPEASPADIRRRCAEEFARMFARTRHVIRGTERLPEGSGHVVIMNHLCNHPDNILPNAFQLTMDTHFVSSMILLPRYGEPPIRVIRRSRSDEFGHQMYYDRLGYLYVAPRAVDGEAAGESRPASADRRREFLEKAAAHLREGRNVVICPEGTSVATEQSPKPFKAGAFRLAAFADPEPLIVPIAVANFDRKLTQTTLVAVVHEPFRLSDHVPRGAEDPELFAFVNAYRDTFAGYVREAVALARNAG